MSAPTATTTQPAQNITLPDIHPFSTENAEEFEEWLERFQFALDCAAANMADEAKVKLLMTMLNPAAFGEYKRYCLPEEITKFGFLDTKSRLIKLFSHPPSLAIDRYECLRVCREEGENFEIFVNRLKASLRKFRFSELNEQEFKCLVLLTSLKSPSDAKLRQHILARLTAEDSKTTKTSKLFDKVVEDLNTQLKTEAEAKILEQPKPKINAIQHGKSTPNHQNRGNGRPNQKLSGKSKAKAPRATAIVAVNCIGPRTVQRRKIYAANVIAEATSKGNATKSEMVHARIRVNGSAGWAVASTGTAKGSVGIDSVHSLVASLRSAPRSRTSRCRALRARPLLCSKYHVM
ncbi:hypothetical protein niasHT_036558 [Heterodera trifolii]|uniref:DUF7083 domain-containing protein n=1 Tax=Heterodera trifolii TaxID=157864 RepID=A0ABD2HWR5_9BILA